MAGVWVLSRFNRTPVEVAGTPFDAMFKIPVDRGPVELRLCLADASEPAKVGLAV